MQFRISRVYNLFEHLVDRSKLKPGITYIANSENCYKLIKKLFNNLDFEIDNFEMTGVDKIQWTAGEYYKRILSNFEKNSDIIKFCPPIMIKGDIKMDKCKNFVFSKEIPNISGTVGISLQGYGIITTIIEINKNIEINYNDLESDPIYNNIMNIHNNIVENFAHFKNIFKKNYSNNIIYRYSNDIIIEITKNDEIEYFDLSQSGLSNYYKLRINSNYMKKKKRLIYAIELAISHKYMLDEILNKINIYYNKLSIKQIKDLIYLILGSYNSEYYITNTLLPPEISKAYLQTINILNYYDVYNIIIQKLNIIFSKFSKHEINYLTLQRDEVANEILTLSNIGNTAVRLDSLNLDKFELFLFDLMNLGYFVKLYFYKYPKLITFSRNWIWELYNAIRKNEYAHDTILKILGDKNNRINKSGITNQTHYDRLYKKELIIIKIDKKKFKRYTLNLDNIIVEKHYQNMASLFKQYIYILENIIKNMKTSYN